MERAAWIEARRRLAEERMDTLWAPIYDEEWGATISPTHRRFVERFLGRLAPRSAILDAACGTGKYWPLLLAAGHTLLGIDQSQGMLSRAHAKFPEVPVEKLALQDMSYQAAFDGVLCVDALEMVVPKDWLRAGQPAGSAGYSPRISGVR